MKIIKQIFIILLFYVIGEGLALLISSLIPNFYIPGTIIGLLVFLVFLTTKKIKIEDVDEVGSFLTNNMAFFFIPAAVSVLEYFDLLRSSFVRIIILLIISVILSFFAIAGTIKLVVYLQNRFRKGSDTNE